MSNYFPISEITPQIPPSGRACKKFFKVFFLAFTGCLMVFGKIIVINIWMLIKKDVIFVP